MRSWLVVPVALAVVAATMTSAGAGSRTPSRPRSIGKVRVEASGNKVRYTRARLGTPRSSNPGSVSCRRWSTVEMVPVLGSILMVPVEHRWRQCFSVSTGRPTGPVREIPTDAPGSGPGEDVWTAVVPDPVIQRENTARFVTQRLAYVWLPAAYFNGIHVDLRSSTGAVLAGAAVARATRVVINPGWGGEANSMDCTLEAQFPFDPVVGYWDQRSCGLLYMKSSLDEPGGVYVATASVTWSVTAVIEGEAVDAATVVTQGQAAFRVEELQALVTCVGGRSSDCLSGMTTAR